MKNIIVKTILFLVFTITVDAFEPVSGNLTQYSKNSEWNTNEHNITLLVLFQDSFLTNFTIHADVQEMLDFKASEGNQVTIEDERPGALVGTSIFSLRFENDAKIYEAEGPSQQVTLKDWGLDENTVMVTKVAASSVLLNGTTEITVINPSEKLIGKIFRIDTRGEKFIPDSPGYSYFTYVSLSDDSNFKTVAPSIKSHWKPSKEQLQNSVTVTWIGKNTVGMSGHIMAFGLSNGARLSLGDASAQIPSWLSVGSRWVKFASNSILIGRNGWIEQVHYVDLNTGAVIQTQGVSSPAGAIRTIPKNW